MAYIKERGNYNYFVRVAHLVDRINCYECFGIGLTDKIHPLSVLVLIHDRNNFFSGGVVICTDNFVKGCSAMKVVEDKTIDLIKLRRNHTNSCLMTGWLRTVLIYYITKCFFCKYFQEFISNWLIFFRKEKTAQRHCLHAVFWRY